MKNKICLFVLALIVFTACGPKPYYETSIGKAKWRVYNKTQYGLPAKHTPKF